MSTAPNNTSLSTGTGLVCCGADDCGLCPACVRRLPVALLGLMARSRNVLPAVFATAVKCSQMWLRAHPVVMLACTTCQLVYQPDPAAFDSGNTGCPQCGGWTWIAQLIPAPHECGDQR